MSNASSSQNSKSYLDFALVYDQLMDNIPYHDWAKYIISLLGADFPKTNKITELGCGTGTITEMLAKEGYAMTGVDLSSEMLKQAEAKKAANGTATTYIHGNMMELSLPEKQDAIICVCDSINYLPDTPEIALTFHNVRENLKDGGIFICDFKTTYFFEEVVGDATIAEDRENVSFIWDNIYDPEGEINELLLTLFIKDEASGLYKKSQELHYQLGLTPKEMRFLAEQVGFTDITLYDAFTTKKPHKKSERVYMICKK